MRINNVPPSIVTPPETRPDVGAVRATNPVQPQGQEGGGATPPLPVPERERAVQGPAPVDRRSVARRRDDRRTKQLPVTLNTRVAQRRTRRRRDEDQPPSNIDVEA